MVVECSKPWEQMRHKITLSKVEQNGRGPMPRFVQCPKCRALLQEPPPGNPFYRCGNCLTTLQAKHATQADLEATNLRMSIDKQSQNKISFSDSSSGEFSEKVVDEFSFGGDNVSPSWSPNRKESPMYSRREPLNSSRAAPPERQNSAEMLSEQGLYGRDPRVTTQQPQVQSQERLTHSYMQSMNNQELDMNQIALESISGAEYIQRRAAQQEAGAIERWPPSPEASHGNSGFQILRQHIRNQPDDTPGPKYHRSNMGREHENESLRPQTGSPNVTGSEMQQQMQASQCQGSCPPALQAQSPGYLIPSDHQGYATNPVVENTGPVDSGSLPSSAKMSKLKWQPRSEAVEEAASPRGLPTQLGLNEGDRVPHDDANYTVSVKETTSVEYVVERDWRALRSRRRSFEDRRTQEEKGTQLVRSGSDGSEKHFDMYDNHSCLGDYEYSETSSTMDEGEGSEAGSSSYLQSHSGETMGRYSPPLLERALSKSHSRPNLPRSNTSSGRTVYSEESNTYHSQSEIDSSDNQPHLDKVNLSLRRQSWDDRAIRTGQANHTSPQVIPGLRRSPSAEDYVRSTPPEHGHSRGSSDPPSGYRAPMYMKDPPQQQQLAGSRPPQQPQQQSYQQQQQQLANRTGQPASASVPPNPAAGSPRDHQRPPQWSQNPSVEHPSQLNSFKAAQSHSGRQMPDSAGQGQLPPRQSTYPPLPPPGALPHVSCQHCRILLAVPGNLPPPKKKTQKLRCGSCMKISTFSVLQAVETLPSRSDGQLGQSLLTSSPDLQVESNSGYRSTTRSLSAASDELKRSGRRFSTSDLSDRSLTMTRNDSMGSNDTPSDDELAERGRALNMESPVNVSMTSEAIISAGYPDLSPSNPEYKSRFSNSGRKFSGSGGPPIYHKRRSHDGGTSSTSQETDSRLDEKSRLAGGNIDHRARGRKRHDEGGLTSSDSENDGVVHTVSTNGSPHQGNSRSPPNHPKSPSPVQDLGATGSVTEHHKEQVHEPRSLNNVFKGIINIKKSVRELTAKTRHAHAGHFKRKVTVNGVAIPDHLVKKAEEQSGPIHPGNYWYDLRAGFWGVAGGQCLGIIPPFIDEFNYPMSKDCAGGKTGITVNGRELHHRDLEKLVRRGLPHVSGMMYGIEIDGRVVDETTGHELKGLGRLAPSLEQKGRGTGMFTPVAGAGNRS